MEIYTPDNWVVLHIKKPVEHYKVLAGWGGGYLSGDHWRLNSGIVRVEKTDRGFDFYGASGTIYRCGRNYCLRNNNAYVYQELLKRSDNTLEIMPEDTDWLVMDWKLT